MNIENLIPYFTNVNPTRNGPLNMNKNALVFLWVNKILSRDPFKLFPCSSKLYFYSSRIEMFLWIFFLSHYRYTVHIKATIGHGTSTCLNPRHQWKSGAWLCLVTDTTECFFYKSQWNIFKTLRYLQTKLKNSCAPE